MGPTLEDVRRVHLVGIGGAGMSALARLMLAQGVPVSGSDAKESRRLVALRTLGAQVHVGHDPSGLDGDPAASVVVVSTAIPPTNPALQTAGFIGVEKQPFLMEVFIAFVYPSSEVTQPELDAVAALDTTNCPQPPNGYQADPNPKRLPPQTINGAGEGFVTYDQDDPSTEPAVVFVADGESRVVVRRETYEDLVRLDQV